MILPSILVVSQDLEFTKTIQNLCLPFGYPVKIVCNCHQAIQNMLHFSADLLVLDAEVLRTDDKVWQLRLFSHRIPAWLFSNPPLPPLNETARRMGILECFPKPINSIHFIAALEKQLLDNLVSVEVYEVANEESIRFETCQMFHAQLSLPVFTQIGTGESPESAVQNLAEKCQIEMKTFYDLFAIMIVEESSNQQQEVIRVG